MRIFSMEHALTQNEQVLLQENMVKENIHRGRIFAKVIITIEIILSVINIPAYISKANTSFHFSFYIFMYITMILLNVSFLLFAKKYGKEKDPNVQFYENILISYMTLFMVWGSIITLADQRLYGQLMAFVINIIGGSVIFYFTHKHLLIPYSISGFLLYVGLPFFQSSTDVLIGHYINLTIFLCLSWGASRILYFTYYSHFKSKILLEQTNKRLEEEIKENHIIHQQLETANKELQNLSLMDELTKIPNRRAFYQYIEYMLNTPSKKDSFVSLIMMDIDYFKPFNDHYGHAEGDIVIKAVAEQINAAVRHPLDFAARLGGEEFVLVSFCKNENEIEQLAEMIRHRVLEMKISHKYSNNHEYVTISIGTATNTINQTKDFDELMRFADEALYAAKANGRNCVKSMKRLGGIIG